MANLEIQARVKELGPGIAKQAEITTNISKAWVIEKLCKTMESAQADKQSSTVAKIIIDIAKVSGVYVDKQEVDWLMTWDGNFKTVSDERLEKIKQLGMQIATQGDPAKIEALKRKALLRSQVIDVPPQNNNGDSG